MRVIDFSFGSALEYLLRMEFHVHVYYSQPSRRSAAALRRRIVSRFPEVWAGRLVDCPVGPHPMPMFELNFGGALFAPVVSWLMLHRAGHRVLVHPVTGHDPKDHDEHAIWLGERVPLDPKLLDPPPQRWSTPDILG